MRSLNEECGVFGIWGHPEASNVTYFGLHSLQHRGQEGAGIVSKEGTKLRGHRDLGLVSEDEWNIAPCSSNSFLKVFALIKLPLWQIPTLIS